jgi:cyclase
MNVRVIPRLDIKGPNLVKGVHMEGLRVLGKPEHYARYYYEAGADELLYVDSVASLYDRQNLIEIIRRTAREIFIPLTVGGGLTSVEDIQAVLRAGADKVSINSAAIQRPEFIREASRKFGSSTIIVSITAIWNPEKYRYMSYTDYGREDSEVDALEWAVRAASLGAGELLITSIDREGTRKGYDINLVKAIAESVSIPVIASGGAGTIEHVVEVVKNGKADAVSMASLLHYPILRKLQYQEKDFLEEGNIEFMKHRGDITTGPEATIEDIKKAFVAHGIGCRHLVSEGVHV